jgi:tetratricopeptide (TPR) repeat protein
MNRLYTAAIAMLLAMPALAGADSITVNNLAYADVKISTVKGEEIYFTTQTGTEVHKPIAHVSKINLTDEPAFNQAEESYLAKDWDKAATSYEKTFRTTNKVWLKDWCSVRLLESANKAGHFDAAVKAYIALAEKSPAAAKTIQLTMPKPGSAYINDAIKDLNSGIARARNEDVKSLLLKLVVDLNALKGDSAASDKALQELAQSRVNLDPSSPEALRAQMMLKLKSIRVALAAKDYEKVISTIEKEAATIVEPVDQAEALLMYADAKAGKAGEDKGAWKDVAVAYMRVAANAPGTPQAASALLKVAGIHETKLGEKDTALKLLKQIAVDYKGQEAGTEAENQLKRLGGA